jgi:hypothetical protein
MRLILDTKNKVITFEEPLTIQDVRDSLRILAPGYDTFDKYKIGTGAVNATGLVKIAKSLEPDYNYRPVFDWIEYVKGNKIVIDEKVSTPQYPTLKQGSWNVEIV